MGIGEIANLATAIAVIIALVFGVLELRQVRKDREERAAFEVVHAMMTSLWIDSAAIVRRIDESISPEQLRADVTQLQAAHSVAVVLEAMGYAVHKRIIPLAMVDELLGGTVRLAWRKLKLYAEDVRQRTGSRKSWEWFQWLAERLEERGPLANQPGAYELYTLWRP